MSESNNAVKRTEMDNLYPLIEEIIKNGGTAKIKVSGTSMYPLVASRRDSVVLGAFESLKAGDVPLYIRPNGRYILHRIIKEKNGNFAIMGDYETKIEYPVSKDSMLAVAKGFYRKGKYISCDSTGYKIYSFLWRFFIPIRPVLLKIIKLLGRMKKRIIEMKKGD